SRHASPTPRPQYVQCAQSIPAARRTAVFELEIRFSFVRVLQRPAAVLPLPAADDVDGFGEARVARCVDGLEIIERSEDVVVPSRRKGEARECRLDDFAGAMRAKEAMYQKELAAPALCGPHFPDVTWPVQFVAVLAAKPKSRSSSIV